MSVNDQKGRPGMGRSDLTCTYTQLSPCTVVDFHYGNSQIRDRLLGGGGHLSYIFLFNRVHSKLMRGSEWSQPREYWIEFTDTPSNEIYTDERKVSRRCE